jgi:hypothetical protein
LGDFFTNPSGHTGKNELTKEEAIFFSESWLESGTSEKQKKI